MLNPSVLKIVKPEEEIEFSCFQLFFKTKKKQLGKKLLLREYYDNLGGDFVKKKIFFSVTIGRSN